MSDAQFILASQSPRRADLLAAQGLRFSIQPADIDESRLSQESPLDYVSRLAREKAGVIADLPNIGLPVLGADTIVVLGDEILGKPQDRADALRMLRLLSGSRHEVLTGVCVRQGARVESAVSRTWVSFDLISPAQAATYWASGEPIGKAGAYAIQGRAEAFVRGISGSHSGVIGLPLNLALGLLQLFNITPPASSPHE